MSSFVEQVLLAAGSQEINTNHINERIFEIQKEIDKLKQDTRKFIVDNYIDFLPQSKKDQEIVVKGESVLNEINKLQKRVDDQIKIKLKTSNKELQTLSNSLKEVQLSLRITNHLLRVHELRLSVKRAINNNQYVEAAKMLQEIHQILFETDTEIQKFDLIDSLNEEYVNLHAQLCTSVSILWRKNVRQEETTNLDNVKINKMYLTNGDTIDNLIKAMSHVEDLNVCLEEFCKKLLALFIKPIILNECSVYIKNSENLESYFSGIFTVEITGKVAVFNHECILHNLNLLFEFLINYFNLKSEENSHVLIKLCEFLYPELSKVLINDFVAKTIPTSSNELKKFAPIREEIIKFEDQLVEYGFIASDSRYLTEYVTNVDNLYTRKIRQGYLVRAKEIMKKDLHDSMKYFPKEPLEIPSAMLDNYTLNIPKRTLSSSTFQLPACQISKSTKEILELIEEILEETCKNSEDCAMRLFYTSRDIIEMYNGLVPLHHKQFLETIPQQVALFHNNCMYLAHHLLILVHKYEDKLPPAIKEHNLTYTDQVLMLRSLGTNYFLNQMEYQRDIIYDILRNSSLAKIELSSKLSDDTEKSLRQCIRQLELLKTVWLHVLPEKVYCRIMGCIMNSMIEELISKVTKVEDIHADVATDLVTFYNIIVRRAPAIFPESQEIQNHVRKWTKLKELIIILGASLKEIEERWAAGKGPLAKEFSAEDVKKLIKALFQNTDRRSALLSKIN